MSRRPSLGFCRFPSSYRIFHNSEQLIEVKLSGLARRAARLFPSITYVTELLNPSGGFFSIWKRRVLLRLVEIFLEGIPGAEGEAERLMLGGLSASETTDGNRFPRVLAPLIERAKLISDPARFQKSAKSGESRDRRRSGGSR